MSQELSHGEWDHLLLEKGYQFVYFDGLNRFYVSPGHLELAKAFGSPPNVFDGFVLSGKSSSPFCSLVDSKAQQAESRAEQAEAAARYWQIQADELHGRILALHASTSWRITKPLRAFKRLLTRNSFASSGTTVAVKVKVKQTLKPVLSASIAYVFKRPVLRKTLSACLKCFPGLHQRLLNVGVTSGAIKAGGAYIGKSPSVHVNNPMRLAVPVDAQHLTPRARQIYNALEVSLKNKNKRERA